MAEATDVNVAVRGWRTDRLPQLAGLAEATQILGREKSTVSSWLEDGSGRGEGHGDRDTFLIPPQYIRAGPIWVRDDLERFAEALGGPVARGDRTPPAVLRPWRTYRLPELAGLAEAIELLGQSKVTIGRWRKPNSGDIPPNNTYLMEPRIVRAGPVWVAEDLRRFAEQIGPQRRSRTTSK